MKLPLLAIFICTQVIWVEGRVATSAAECLCNQIKIINNGDGNLMVGVWDRIPGALIYDRPVYKKQSILDELYLKWDNYLDTWQATASPTEDVDDTTNPTAGSNIGLSYCAEDLVSADWFVSPSQQLGNINDQVPADMTTRCVDCVANPEDCGTCDCQRIKVVNVTSESNGYYLPLIGIANDGRAVYKRVGSGSDPEVYLISALFNWCLTTNITAGTAIALKNGLIDSTTINATHCAENTPRTWTSMNSAVRCSDCSSNKTAEYEECAASCPPCKDVLEGTMMGLYTLEADKDARCTNGCVYRKENNLYCFKEGGPSVKLWCGTP